LYKFQRFGRRQSHDADPVPILRDIRTHGKETDRRRRTRYWVGTTSDDVASSGALIYIYIGIIQGTNKARGKERSIERRTRVERKIEKQGGGDRRREEEREREKGI